MTRLNYDQVDPGDVGELAGFGRIVPGDARHSLFHSTDKDGKVKRVSSSSLAHAQAAIAAYRSNRTSVTLNVAWEVLCRLWARHSVPDEPDEEGPLYRLCYQFAYALEAEGYDPDQDDDEDILEDVARQLYDYLPGDRDFLDLGSFDSGDGYLAVDLLSGKVVVSKQPAVQTVRRQDPKIGRNDPCPCGSGKKYKRCGRLDLCNTEQPVRAYPNLLG